MAVAKSETAPKTKRATSAAKPGVEAKPAATEAAVAKSPAAEPAAKKPASRAAAKATAVEKTPAVAEKPAAAATSDAAAPQATQVSPEQRYMMICEAAYFKAERRGFSAENEVQDWLDAEAEINRLLGM